MKLEKYFAELIGTFAIVFFGCGSVILASLNNHLMSPSLIPFMFGLTVATMIYTLGHISNAHFNPAVTIAFALIKKFAWKEVLPYVAFQILGAILASALHLFLFQEIPNFGDTHFQNISTSMAFGWEMILTFFLMFVITAVATDARAQGLFAGLAIGLIVTICAALGGPMTGASMNPARSIGPALMSGNFNQLWLYLIAPIIGAAFGAFIYQYIKCEKQDPKNQAGGCC